MNNSFKSSTSRRAISQSPYQRPSGSNAARYASDPLGCSSDAGSFTAGVENRPLFRSPGAMSQYNFGPTEADDAPLLHQHYRHDNYGHSGPLTSLQHHNFLQDVSASPQQGYNCDLQLTTAISGEGGFYGYNRGSSTIVSNKGMMPPSVPASPIFMNFQQDRLPSAENRNYGSQLQLESGFGSYPLRHRREAYSPVYLESDVRSQTPPSFSQPDAIGTASSTCTSLKKTSSAPLKIKAEVETPKESIKRRQSTKSVMMVFSGSTDKTKKWQKAADIPEKELLFEVVAPLVAVRQGGHRCAKTLLLRDHGKPTQQWDFYEIDRPLPLLQKGQLVRCVGRLVNKHKLQAFSVRVATEQEKSQFGRLGFISQRIISGMALTAPEA